MVQVLRK